MSSGRAYVLLLMYLLLFLFRHSFSEFPRPIALKLCHMVGIWLNFIIPLQKFGGRSPKKILNQSGPKLTEILHVFGPQFFGGDRPPPSFWSGIIKFSHIPTMWQSFRAIGRGSSENEWRNKKRRRYISSKTARPELPFRAA